MICFFVYIKDLARKYFVFYNNITAGISGNNIIFHWNARELAKGVSPKQTQGNLY